MLLTNQARQVLHDYRLAKRCGQSIQYRENKLNKQDFHVFALLLPLFITLLIIGSCTLANAYDADQFCDAVYLAEGGSKAKKPYGVLSVPCNSEAECRKICINSYNNNQKRFVNQSKYTDFVEFFGSRWCPIGATNDPQGLNKNWVKNVKFFLKKG